MPQNPELLVKSKQRPFTGAEYLESLRDGREVYIYGERVRDVTKHPAFRNAAASVAKLYDALHDPKRKETLTEVIGLGRVIKKFGGTFAVLAPNSVKRVSYDFKENRANVIAALNDYATAVTDLGLGTGLHQHTGTCIETRDEVYDVMESANTKYLKFAPDVGQLQKGGADAAKVVKDFLPLVRHMHLKDYLGGEHYAGYCPLGMGKVDIPAILDMVESVSEPPNVMVELDPSSKQPMTPLETAQTSKAYLQKLGYKFRS